MYCVIQSERNKVLFCSVLCRYYLYAPNSLFYISQFPTVEMTANHEEIVRVGILDADFSTTVNNCLNFQNFSQHGREISIIKYQQRKVKQNFLDKIYR